MQVNNSKLLWRVLMENYILPGLEFLLANVCDIALACKESATPKLLDD